MSRTERSSGRTLAVIFSVGALSACTADPAPSEPAESPDLPTLGSIERLDPRLDAIVPADAALEVIARGEEGERWTEGPVWVSPLDSLLYSEIPSNTVYRWREGDEPSAWLRPSGYTGAIERGGESGSNGLALDRQGRLLLAQHGDRRVARLDAPWDAPEATFVTLAGEFEGRRFNSPNDIAVRSNGDLYFTDPPYGLEGGMDDPAKELDFQGVYRVTPDGSISLLIDGLSRPNGIAFSPDEQVLYVANSDREQPVIMAYDVAPDGSLENARVFFDSWGDGMAVDELGNLYVAGPRNGVLIVAPDGTHLGSLLSDRRASNCAFGDDGSMLYVTGVHVLRARLLVRGAGFE